MRCYDTYSNASRARSRVDDEWLAHTRCQFAYAMLREIEEFNYITREIFGSLISRWPHIKTQPTLEAALLAIDPVRVPGLLSENQPKFLGFISRFKPVISGHLCSLTLFLLMPKLMPSEKGKYIKLDGSKWRKV